MTIEPSQDSTRAPRERRSSSSANRGAAVLESVRSSFSPLRRLRLFVLLGVLLALAIFVLFVGVGTRMPGTSHARISALADAERALVPELRRRREAGGRNRRTSHAPPRHARRRAEVHPRGLAHAGYWVEEEGWKEDGVACANVIAERLGTSDAGAIVLVGAHYNSVPDCPSADDNGSGVAALLVLARHFATTETRRTVRFVAFASEEPPSSLPPPWAARTTPGAAAGAGSTDRDAEPTETLGYYSDAPGASASLFQVSATSARRSVTTSSSSGTLRRAAVRGPWASSASTPLFPCESAALPWWIPGVGWSDKLSFWREGFPR
jgi:hypothetical protein